jgi:hypothetical protein
MGQLPTQLFDADITDTEATVMFKGTIVTIPANLTG